MTDKVDPIEILLERRQEIETSSTHTRSIIADGEHRAKVGRENLITETNQLNALDAALAKLGYYAAVEKDKKK